MMKSFDVNSSLNYTTFALWIDCKRKKESKRKHYSYYPKELHYLYQWADMVQVEVVELIFPNQAFSAHSVPYS